MVRIWHKLWTFMWRTTSTFTRCTQEPFSLCLLARLADAFVCGVLCCVRIHDSRSFSHVVYLDSDCDNMFGWGNYLFWPQVRLRYTWQQTLVALYSLARVYFGASCSCAIATEHSTAGACRIGISFSRLWASARAPSGAKLSAPTKSQVRRRQQTPTHR